MSNFSYSRLRIFDGTDIFASENEAAFFPFHFHKEVCVSIITKGVELFYSHDSAEIICPRGRISITNSKEIHRNQSFFDDGYSYKTIYLNTDVLKYFNHNIPVNWLQSTIEDYGLYQKIDNIISNRTCSNNAWSDMIRHLLRYQTQHEQEQKHNKFLLLEPILEWLEDGNLSIPALARKFFMSPYHFIREFKKFHGVTPQSYVLLYRLHQVKQQLKSNSNLLDISLAHGFYDVSHLSKTFKHYFGTSIHHYKNSNILPPGI